MTCPITAHAASLGLPLESASAPAANYVPFVRDGNLLYLSGQISRNDGQPAYLGRLGDNISVNDGAQAARVLRHCPRESPSKSKRLSH